MGTKNISANIPKYYLLSAIQGLQYFFIPIYIIFLLGKGLSFTEVMLLETIYSGVVVLLEIPTGYFADLKGRKPSLLLAAFGYIAAFVIFAFGNSFADFALSMLLWAGAVTFSSGADTALLYDTLLSMKQERRFARVAGVAGFLSSIGATAAFLIGGYLANLKLSLPFLPSIAAAAVVVLIVMMLKEPPRERLIISKGYMRKLADILKSAARNKIFIYLVLYNIFLVPAWLVLFYLIQPLAAGLGLPPSILGIMYAIMTASSAFGMLVGPRLYHLIKVGWQLLGIAILAGLSMLFLALSKTAIGLAGYVVMSLSLGVVSIILITSINHLVRSDRRATLLSISSALNHASIAVLAAVTGPLIDNYSLHSVIAVSAVIVLLGCSLSAVLIVRQKIAEPRKEPQNSLILSNSL